MEDLRLAFSKHIFAAAAQCDNLGFSVHAQQLYIDGIKVMKESIVVPDELEVKQKYYTVLNDYQTRLNKLNEKINKALAARELVLHIDIPEGGQGFGYDSVLADYISQSNITQIIISDPEMYKREHFDNLVTFVGTLKQFCSDMKFLLINTSRNKADVEGQRDMMAKAIADFQLINLAVKVSYENESERRIILNNGYIVESARGLHFYKPQPLQLCVGKTFLDVRQCVENQIDIFRCKPF